MQHMAVTTPTPDAPTPLRQSIWEKRRTRKVTLIAYLWLSPLLLCMLAILIYPLLNGFYLSFTNADQTNIAETIGVISYPATYKFIGLTNYVNIIRSWFTAGP